MDEPVAQLIIQFEGKTMRTLPLNTPVLIIGRTPENSLPLPSSQVSRRHAELRLDPQGLILTDLGSSNGTMLNGQRLLPNRPQLLTDGATFLIGPYLLTYRAASSLSSLPQAPDDAAQPDLPTTLPPATPTTPPPALTLASSRPVTPLASRPPRKSKPNPRNRIAEQDSLFLLHLPDIFQENDFLKRFLLIFEDIWEPLEQRQDHISMYFDPQTCPVSFLPWLASWLDLPFSQHWPEARRRHLLTQAMDLYSWRGTNFGLTRMIEVFTGLTPQITEIPSQPFIFRIRVTLPPGAPAGAVDKAMIEELIQAHKPAHAGYILEVT